MKMLVTMALLVLASLYGAAQFASGYYIDSTGNKVPGLLKYTFGGSFLSDKSKGDCRLHYKHDSDAKAVKFTAKDIKGFVIGTDSFTVIHNFHLNFAANYPVDFIRVLEIGKIKLLQYDAIMPSKFGTDDIAIFILEKDKKGYTMSGGNFRKTLETLMEEDPELLEKIRNKEYKFKHLREVVVMYNKYVAEHS